MKKIVLIISMITIFPLGLFAAAGKGVPGAFADIGLSRPSSMGGAFTAVADDENVLFYNPAGLSRMFGTGDVDVFISLPLVDASKQY